ncbi:translocation/assembly module TamB [Buchnera aphidicola (Aphis fabae)]|uniref:Translocation/assembly module TamB n=1 Tax=Buchnera aphidicola (Aphis fabae) TaxID=571430 RepID=A0A5J6ZF21_9GAMM|nr:translocation/assembly module TamB [Buchnera aphidicola]QFQ32825.1 translocation/assembly module TamB [Buchnera aphidicola (Aphis fabae)]
MSIYQRYLSKSLIFFSSLIFLIVFFLESNLGFKLFFNITNYFFLGLKKESISGNWRDFTLKNITYNFFGTSIKATSIHILIDPTSLFKVHKIFKKIETKNLIFLFNKNNLFSLKRESFKKNISEKYIFFSNYIILKNIYSDKILLKSHDINILLSNVNSGVKLINNNFTILSTYVDSISLNLKKNNPKDFLNKKNIFNKKKINNFLSFLSYRKNFSFPININLTSIQCKKMNFFHYQFKNILFRGSVNSQFKFKLKFNDFFKCNLYGKVLLNNLNHPIYINLYIHRLLFPIKKNLIFASKNFNITLKGTINNYYVSLKNIINIPGMPSVILNIFGGGNLTNIYLNQIHCTPFFKKYKNNKLVGLNKENNDQYISKIKGNINILNNFKKGINSINIPSFNVKANIIDKKLLVLGALYYNQINGIQIPKISFFSGKNKGFLAGSISNLININSSINANNLDYFIPNLKGAITSTFNIYGFYFSPIVSGLVLGNKLNWNNMIYLNSFKMLININAKKNISFTMKKIKFLKFYLDFLNVKFHWNKMNQNFYFYLKNKNFTINFIVNGKFNYQKRFWKGIFKKINISTFNKQWIINNHPVVFLYNYKNIEINKKNEIKYKNSISSKIRIVKKFLYSSILNSSINFKTNLFFQTKFISTTKKKFSNIKIFLHANNIKLQKKIKNKSFFKKISCFKLFVNFKKNNLITHWAIYPLKNKNKRLFGFLNVFDFFHKQNIQGKYFLLNFPSSILNFFIPHSTIIEGTCIGNIKFLGTLYQPHISADIHLKNFYIKSNKILKYIVLFFYPSLNLIKYVKINQSIFIKQGNVLFKLYSNPKNNLLPSLEWNIFFNSDHVLFFVLPKMKLNLCSQLNLHYFLLKYDLIGYLKSHLFYFKIDEKNFIF